MLQARIDAFHDIIKNKPRDEVVNYAVYYFAEHGKVSEELDQLKSTWNEMIVQFQQMKDELAGARSEIQVLRELNCHLTGVRDIQNKDLFGRKTEKAEALFNDAINGVPCGDPLSEDAACPDAEPGSSSGDDPDSPSLNKNPFSHSHEKEKSKGKTAGKRERDLSKLPHQTIFDYDIELLDRLYGKGNWRFVYWHKHRSVEVIRQFTYVKVTYTPVISSGLEHSLITIPYDKALLQKSLVSQSLLATIMTDKYGLYLPLNRQADDPGRFGLPISRQTLSNWVVGLTLELLKPVYEFLRELLIPYPYQQCDETTYLVIHNGKPTCSKGYIWVHRSSTLYDAPQIIIYVYENSRAAEHLRSFYGELSSHINLTCDAYSAYPAFEKDDPQNITLCGCLMHARRRFVDALRICNFKDLSEDQIKLLPETTAISILRDAYREETALNHLTADERLSGRIANVKRHIDRFFDFIRSLDVTDPCYSDKLKDAILYSRNHEIELRRFLSDGNIPADNGASERSVKPIAIGRRNYLFSNTLEGAEATVIISSLIETAKASGVEPYYYLKYLLDIMPDHVRRGIPITDKTVLTPWSETVREYQLSEKQSYLDSLKAPPGNSKPRTPRKRDPIPLQNTA